MGIEDRMDQNIRETRGHSAPCLSASARNLGMDSVETAGRTLVERNYCLQVTTPRLAAILRSAVGGNAGG